MNPDEPTDPPHLSPVGDAELEARIVAWVLGEASAFEAAELERLCEESPELKLFHQRILAVHGLVAEDFQPLPDENWRLSEERRAKVTALFGADEAAAGERRTKRVVSYFSRRALLATAACVTVTAISWPLYQVRLDKEQSGLTAAAEKAPRQRSAGDRQARLAELEEAVRAQEKVVEAKNQALQTIIRMEDIVYKRPDGEGAIPTFDDNESTGMPAKAYVEAEGNRIKLESQITALLDYDGEQLNQYAAGLDIPDNLVNTLYPQYLESKRELDKLRNEEGLGERNPRVLAQKSVVDGMSKDMDHAVESLRDVLGMKLELNNRELKKLNERRSVTKNEAVQTSIHESAFSLASEDFKEASKKLEELKLAAIRESIDDRVSERELPALAAEPSAKPAASAASALSAKSEAASKASVPNGELAATSKPSTLTDTDGLGSGSGAVTRNNIDAVLNNPGRKADQLAEDALAKNDRFYRDGSQPLDEVTRFKRSTDAPAEPNVELDYAGGTAQLADRKAGGRATDERESLARNGEEHYEWKGQAEGTKSEARSRNQALAAAQPELKQSIAETDAAGREPSGEVRVGEVTIAGNTRSKERVIRRELTLKGEASADLPELAEGAGAGAASPPLPPAAAPMPKASDSLASGVSGKPQQAPANGPMGRDGLAGRENVERGSTVAGSDQLRDEGRTAYANGNYKEAVDKLQKSLQELPEAPSVQDRRDYIQAQLGDASLALSEQYRRVGKYGEARKMAEDALKADPNDQRAKAQLSYLDDPIRTNPALTNGRAEDVDQVRRGLYTAEGFYNLGKFDDAKKQYEDVLRTDPYNKDARHGMEQVAQARADYYSAAYDQTRADIPRGEVRKDTLSQVDAAWEFSVPRVEENTVPSRPAGLDFPKFDPVEIQEPMILNGVAMAMKRHSEIGDSFSRDLSISKFGDSDPSAPSGGASLNYNPGAYYGALDPNQVGFGYILGNNLFDSAGSNSSNGLEKPATYTGFTLTWLDYDRPKLNVPMIGGLFGADAASQPQAQTADPFGDSAVWGADALPVLGLKQLAPNPVTAPAEAAKAVEDSVLELQKAEPNPLKEISAAEEAFSTFSLHVSDASFRLAKAALDRGERPDPDGIREEEFYNAFDYGDPPAATEPVVCVVESAAHPIRAQRDLVRIGVRAGSAGRAASTPLNLVLLLDSSGSMERDDRHAGLLKAVGELSKLLKPGDTVSVVGFSRKPRLLVDRLSGGDFTSLATTVANSPVEGGTDLAQGLKLAGEIAARQFQPQAQNRIVLFTDGAANLGDANPDSLAAMIQDLRQQKIAFDAAGFGAEGLNDKLLEQLTRHGDGRYYVVNHPEDAGDRFAQQLAGAFRPAAENVKVQVRFNPSRVGHYRLAGFAEHRLNKEDFHNDAVDAAEMAAEEAGNAIYEVEPLPNGEGEIGEVSVRFREAATGQMVERTWTIPYEAQAPAFDQARPSLQLAGLSLFAAEKLKGGTAGGSIDFNTMNPVVAEIRQRYGAQPAVAQLIEMIGKLR